jgi:uncharacterized coiled-coil DUF342 family protein
MAPPQSKKAAPKAPKTAPATASPAADSEQTSVQKPDQAAYNQEQDALRKQIDQLTAQLNALREKISLATAKGGPGNDRRTELRAELDKLKGQQSGIKGNRSKIFDQLNALQDGTQKRVKDLQTAKQKTPFKTVAEIETHIKNQERQIESGSLSLVGEKKAIADISASKRARKTVEGFEAEQAAIDADRAKADELRKQLDDPEAKAISDRFNSIKAELDVLKTQGDEAYANRNKLFDERKTLEGKLNDLWSEKKEKTRLHKEAGDRYYKRVAEERAKKAERYAAQRAAAEEEKRTEIAQRLREEAETPAFQAQIEDCQTLIDFLSGKVGGATSSAAPILSTNGRSEIAGVPKLEARVVDAPEGLVARKKKGEDDDNYFVSSKGKKKGGAKAASASSPAATPSDAKLNLPLATLSALMSLSIPPPSSTSDIPRAVEDLKTKREWFLANQAHVTAENIAKADAEIAKLAAKSANGSGSGAVTPSGLPNGKAGEFPVEPVPTPAVEGVTVPGTDGAVDEVDNKLEEIKEEAVEA